MATPLRPSAFFDALADEHRRWLSTFDPQYLANWEKVFAGDQEAALVEAGVRRLLEGHGAQVEPNEDLTWAEQRPDFHCQSNGSGFEVEVTHISIDKATKAMGLTEDPPTFSFYSPLNGAIFRTCVGKAKQCSHARHPTLLVVATFHSHAAALCLGKRLVGMLLTGETNLVFGIGQKAGEAYETTELRSAAFLRPDTSQELGFARSSISALILCGLRPLWRDRTGVWGPLAIGVLHPNAERPFNPVILPQVEFGQVAIDRASRQLHVAWPQGGDK